MSDEVCFCGKRAIVFRTVVFRTVDGAKWCWECSPYAKWEKVDPEARCKVEFPDGSRCHGRIDEAHEHWLPNF